MSLNHVSATPSPRTAGFLRRLLDERAHLPDDILRWLKQRERFNVDLDRLVDVLAATIVILSHGRGFHLDHQLGERQPRHTQ